MTPTCTLVRDKRGDQLAFTRHALFRRHSPGAHTRLCRHGLTSLKFTCVCVYSRRKGRLSADEGVLAEQEGAIREELGHVSQPTSRPIVVAWPLADSLLFFGKALGYSCLHIVLHTPRPRPAPASLLLPNTAPAPIPPSWLLLHPPPPTRSSAAPPHITNASDGLVHFSVACSWYSPQIHPVPQQGNLKCPSKVRSNSHRLGARRLGARVHSPPVMGGAVFTP